MYLKTLELQGFKSFADRTSIELQSGIAAIVGPNGSGKSNVVEAIKWVLGEQKAKSLRGHKMEDVIFNGTKKRKPLGMAEVNLILDNSDHGIDYEFTEIKVTRRLYRSGDGEYLINGKNCRLKDIQRLFADTGIGNDGYSVISQGRISQIVEAKPEERRSMVEETAGIVKYRERKKEALRKIANADDNLLRLKDIMTEIESRLGPLEQDSVNAQKYLTFKEEKDTLAMGILAESALDAKKNLEKLLAESDEIQLKYDAICADIITKEAILEDEKANLLKLEDAFGREQQRYHDLSHGIQTAEGEIKSLDSRIFGYDDKLNMLNKEIADLKIKYESAQSKAQSQGKNNEELKEKTQILKEKMDDLQEKRMVDEAHMVKAERHMENLRNEAFEVAREIGHKKNEKISLEQTLETLKKRLLAMDLKKQEYSEDEEVLNQRIEEINDFLDELLTKENEINAKKQQYKDTLLTEKTKINSKRENVMSLKMELSRSEARLKILEELIFKREGFYPGVKAVLEEKSRGKLDGILGVVAEVIKVDKKYAGAIEAVLGSGLQNLVAATGADASKAVAFLKQNRKGVATFLPLDMLKVRPRSVLPEAIKNNTSFIGVAADFVNIPIRMQSVVEYSLGNTLLFQNLDDAIKAAKKAGGNFRYVTPEGDIINSGGSVSGGSREVKKNSFLQRQTEMEELRRRTLEIINEEKIIHEEIETITENRESIKKQLDILDHKREELAYEKTAFDGEIKKIDTRREIYARETESLNLEAEQILAEETQAQAKIENLTNFIDSATVKEAELLGEIEDKDQKFKNAKVTETQGRDDYTQLQIAYTEEKALLENSILNLERLESEATDCKNQLSEKEEMAKNTEAVKAEAFNKASLLKENVMAKNLELADFSDDLGTGKVAKEELTAKKEALENTLKIQVQSQNQYKENLYKLSVKQERLTVESEQSEAQLRDEFQLILADALPYIREDITKKEKRERIKLLKQQIAVLGIVNVGAIEEFKTVSQRYEFLTAQRDDVLAAKTSLEEIVGRMDAIIMERFTSTFDKINESFQETFPAFFQGGYGELRLSDPANPLETGVEVVVQPPGKRLQHHSLLSGGELALSGIALLFAILKVKPSPFYVLDEIDAALDDVNVRKFGSYLEAYGVNSQFLVITHRQGTMESAQELYGITMAEEGVSRTVSVRLEDAMKE
ncbi:MAG: chromosome segregation protein SMC [Clostridiales bacterium]